LLYDLGPHLIDQTLLLFGKPRRLLADLRIERVSAKTIDAFDLVMDYGQHRARLRAGMLVAQPSPRFRIEGSAGGFSKYGTDGQEEQLKRGERPGATQWGEDNPDLFGTLTTVEGEKRTDQRVRTELGAYEVFYRQLAEAIDSNAAAPVDPVEANTVIRVIEAAMQSHQSGRWIDFA
jgi:scyllo-inositol 2-dehydrogenase (NADP+)